MAIVQSSYELVFIPSYRIFALRDIDMAADSGLRDALFPSDREVVTATDCDIYVKVSQDILPVRVVVNVYGSPPGRSSWLSDVAMPSIANLHCPSGQLLLCDIMGSGLAGIDIPCGQGSCSVAIYWRGRKRAEAARASILRAMAGGATPSEVEELQGRNSGVEEYLLEIW
ncbi:hypothetical protein ACSNOB_17860 [Micromonospora sp. URMC 106]|uniref:hypothetical protein n=1 Tax=Micromonospora sp. URMC 106 TaxID=3423408 RepID=UPI003F1BE6B8